MKKILFIIALAIYTQGLIVNGQSQSQQTVVAASTARSYNEGASGSTSASTSTAPAPSAMTSIYRVGIGDVLDIQLLNAPTRTSTLYTVLAAGLLDYTLAGGPLRVVGMTTDEIAAQLALRIKLYDKPQVNVAVREYASHHVTVTGLVQHPGSKVLRREAVPLYVVIAQAQPSSEAGRATIVRGGSQPLSVDLADAAGMETLVGTGDLIKVSALPQFYFIGGELSTPGQKSFHSGITLSQAVLAAGGTTRRAESEVKVSRQGANGLLATTKYNLKKIEDGKVPDPVLQPGDRVEVSRGGWWKLK